MPPRVRLTADEQRRLPGLLALRPAEPFPSAATTAEQAAWIVRAYAGASDGALTTNLVTLLLFERGHHLAASEVEGALRDAAMQALIQDSGDGWTGA